MKNNYNNLNIVPVVSYINADINRFIVYKENKGKCGVYRWKNKITGKSYIGSSVSLSNRFRNYYSPSYLKRRVEIGSSAIYSALLKYGYSNFDLDILEYCKPDILISREQYFIDLLNPEYNILFVAGSRLGTKQTDKTKTLISKALKDRIFSKKSKVKMQEAARLRKGNKTSFFGKSHTVKTITSISIKRSIFVKVTNIETGVERTFIGNRLAAKYLNIGESTLRRYKKLGKLVSNKYLISNT